MNEIFILIALLIGYYLGSKRNIKSDLEPTVTLINDKILRFKQSALNLANTPIESGAIKRPDAKYLSKLHEDDKIKEAKASVKETLDNVPELQEAKRRVEQLKKEGRWIE